MSRLFAREINLTPSLLDALTAPHRNASLPANSKSSSLTSANRNPPSSSATLTKPRARPPAFITMVVMPFSFSISDGILIGLISYVLLNALCGNFKNITPTMWVLAILFVVRYIFI